MPVRGLRKYLSASSQLFDHKLSRADIISIDFDPIDRLIFVGWRIEGVLNLPWHPPVKPWTGKTTYQIDSSGLISEHTEKWDISVIDAFLSTLLPESIYRGSPAASKMYTAVTPSINNILALSAREHTVLAQDHKDSMS